MRNTVFRSMEKEGDEDSFINTYTGLRFHPTNPSPDEIRLEDIAQGLSLTCRYAGQCEFFYSVALHSVHVSDELMERGHGPKVQMHGLLHDAPEAYLSDIPGPVKAHLPEYRQMEESILKAVWKAFGLETPDEDEWKVVKKADEELLNYEAEFLLSADWNRKPSGKEFDLSETDSVKQGFIEKTKELSQELGLEPP